ncbi:MAG: hypothetical protein R3F48_17975 [Candidatus Zixiibacteriota bacterium]
MQGKKLYVGNLSYTATVEQVITIFEEFGEVVNANVITGKGFGFVEFANAEQASNALEALDGQLFGGRNIKVASANPPRKKGEPGSKLYVGNVNYSVTIEQLTKLFEQFGEICHLNLLDGRGYGFVEFARQNEAAKAREELDGKEFEGRNLRIDFAGKKKDAEAEPKRPPRRETVPERPSRRY